MFGAVLPTQAQLNTGVFISPPENTVFLNGTQTISVAIDDGVNVNAIDVEITYDSSKLAVVSWQSGGYLTNETNFYYSNTPGRLRLAYVQKATPGKYGDGNLLNIVFRGTANGISPLTITFAGLYGPTGTETLPQVQHGTLTVHSDPAPLPKRTLTGNFSMQGRSTAPGIPVTLGFGAQHWLGPYTVVTGATVPNFSLANTVDDSYLVTTAMARCLNVTADLNKSVTVSASHYAMTPLQLKCGNAVWQNDNVINAADVAVIGGQYLQTGANLDGDVNFSGRVDIFDLAIAAANYDLTSTAAYAGWNP